MKKSDATGKQPGPNRAAITAHLTTIHEWAKATGAIGVLVLCGFGEDPTTGKSLPPKVQLFQIGEVIPMVDKTLTWTMERYCNVYLGLTIMRHDLTAGSRGGTQDIVRVFRSPPIMTMPTRRTGRPVCRSLPAWSWKPRQADSKPSSSSIPPSTPRRPRHSLSDFRRRRAAITGPATLRTSGGSTAR